MPQESEDQSSNKTHWRRTLLKRLAILALCVFGVVAAMFGPRALRLYKHMKSYGEEVSTQMELKLMNSRIALFRFLHNGKSPPALDHPEFLALMRTYPMAQKALGRSDYNWYYNPEDSDPYFYPDDSDPTFLATLKPMLAQDMGRNKAGLPSVRLKHLGHPSSSIAETHSFVGASGKIDPALLNDSGHWIYDSKEGVAIIDCTHIRYSETNTPPISKTMCFTGKSSLGPAYTLRAQPNSTPKHSAEIIPIRRVFIPPP